METQQVRRHVISLFPGSGPRTTRVAVEHELLTADRETGAAVPIDRIRAATRHASYAGHLAFEPGGQVELSLPCVPCPVALGHAFGADIAALRSDCAAAGVRLDATAVDPRPIEQVPLQLTSPRYAAMQRHFDSIGPAGRTMMRRTASTQVCLDWWPGVAGLEQWRLLNVAGPYLAAAYARGDGPTSRLATWLSVDPSRTAFDDRLLRGDDPVAAYAGFAARAAVFTRPGDIHDHLTTLFPPVRPRGRYLEVRFLDVQPDSAVEPLVASLGGLLYDDARRRRALRMLGAEVSRLGDLWRRAAAGDGELRERGRELVSPSRTPARLVGAA
ncbi:MAG: glutamate-cysteine ligase family protein [Actinomycetota bacterium]|nr:glutamate-cysteine ligase family protein [Actinomycetota bacterium]